MIKAAKISSQLYNFCVRRPLQRRSLSGTTVGSRLPWSNISDFIGRPRLTATPSLLNVHHNKVATKAPGPYNFSGSPTRLINCPLPERKVYTVGGTRHLTYSQTSKQGTSILQTCLPYAEDAINSESSIMHSEKRLSGTMSNYSFEADFYLPLVDAVPPWGLASICGQRQNMEDAVAIVPRFLNGPVIGDHVRDAIAKPLSHLAVHFFGVYDGHGGSRVANYCRDRIHSALAEEVEVIMANLNDTSGKDICEEEWRRAFTKCFHKVDDEIGRKAGLGPYVAPATCGSTAVVAIVCPSYMVVANCGDSRAVLYRGTKSIPLSADHKPSREDEYARIKAASGKVRKWNTPYQVNGVLAKRVGDRLCTTIAVSRAIGDGYWKPWVIPEPEVMFIPRSEEDGILVLASDGLWDVMTNQDVCEIAMERIEFWYENTSVESLVERCEGVDPAATAAAEYLSNLAVKRGSKDNISVLVIDLAALP